MRHITFQSKELGTKTTAILMGPTMQVEHHPEGFVQVQRMCRMSYVEWQGAPGWELQIPIMFDGFTQHPKKSVEASIRRLERMGEPIEKLEPIRPPLLTIHSNGDVPKDYKHNPRKRWVIYQFAWGDYFSDNHGNRTRQPCTVTLWEWISAEVVTEAPQSKQKAFEVSKPGDTLQKVSQRAYGSPKYDDYLAKVNDISDTVHLTTGSTIKTPPYSPAAAKAYGLQVVGG